MEFSEENIFLREFAEIIKLHVFSTFGNQCRPKYRVRVIVYLKGVQSVNEFRIKYRRYVFINYVFRFYIIDIVFRLVDDKNCVCVDYSCLGE